MNYPGVAEAIAYAGEVVAGRISVGELAKIACERFLRNIDDADEGKKGPWEFRPDLAEAAMVFAGMLPNIKGPMAGQPLRLMGWQCLIFANLFGFVEHGTDIRRFRQAIVFVPRGNGKTTIAAPIVLYLSFADDEGGAEGYTAAVSRDQARICFDVAQNMLRRSPAVRREYGIEVNANSIVQPSTASKLIPISSDAKSLEGLSVAVAVCDEIASHKTSEVYDVLLTACGKRRHPLLLSISTATGNSSGIGKQLWDYSVRVLQGLQDDDRLFALIYTIDDTDDPWNEATWVKANPSWGQAVQPDAIKAIMHQARNNAAQEAAARSRHLNLWIGADDALFSLRAWRECGDPTLKMDDLEGKDCILALDWASKTDLAALTAVFPDHDADGRQLYTVFSRCYINEAAVLEARNASYPGWAAADHLVLTSGNETDFGLIEQEILSVCARFNVLKVVYDPWNAAQLSQRLRAEGVEMYEFPARTQYFSDATKELDAAMRAGRIRHNGNPVLEWCIGNVVGHFDPRGNVFPRKARPENKIDAAITVIMAIRAALDEPEGPYSDGRSLLII